MYKNLSFLFKSILIWKDQILFRFIWCLEHIPIASMGNSGFLFVWNAVQIELLKNLSTLFTCGDINLRIQEFLFIYHNKRLHLRFSISPGNYPHTKIYCFIFEDMRNLIQQEFPHFQWNQWKLNFKTLLTVVHLPWVMKGNSNIITWLYYNKHIKADQFRQFVYDKTAHKVSPTGPHLLPSTCCRIYLLGTLLYTHHHILTNNLHTSVMVLSQNEIICCLEVCVESLIKLSGSENCRHSENF